HVSALRGNAGDTGYSRDGRLDDIIGVIIEIGLRQRVGPDVIRDYRENRGRDALNGQIGVGGQRAAYFGNARLQLLQGILHVRAFLKVDVDFGGATDCLSADPAHVIHLPHGLLEKARDGYHYAWWRHVSGIDDNSYARKGQLGINVAGQIEI